MGGKTASKKSEKSVKRNRRKFRNLLVWNREIQLSLLFWITVSLVTYLLLPSQTFEVADYTPGSIAQRDIKATRSFLVEDEATTAARKREAAAEVPVVYDYDRDQTLKNFQSVREFFRGRREMVISQRVAEELFLEEIRSASPPDREGLKRELEYHRSEVSSDRLVSSGTLIEKVSLDLDPEDMEPLFEEGFSERMESILSAAMKPIQGAAIVENRESLLRERGRGISLRTISGDQKEVFLEDFSGVMSMEIARSEVRKVINSVNWTGYDTELRQLMERLTLDLVRPNMTFNRSETENRRKKAIQGTSPVYYQVQRGEVIVRAGDPITEEQALKIRELKKLTPVIGRTSLILGQFLFVAMIIFTLYMVLLVGYRQISTDMRGLVIIAIVIVLQMAVLKGFMVLIQALSNTYPGLSEEALRFVAPYALGSMVAGTLFPVMVPLIVTTLISIFSAAFLEWSHTIFVYSFLGGLAATFSVTHCRQRSSLIKAGLAVSGANIIVGVVFHLYSGEFFSASIVPEMISAAGSGIFVTLIASLAIPVIESTFNVASDMKLMELANLNQPALKKMILRAPGSYHHSVLVGSLAEAAAEEIGANPLLARVAAAYHDIGKMNKPEYFVENQEDRDNRHAKLSPNMSALILSSHVKDGAEIGREFHLPRRIIDIIKQHHGTRLITFFFSKAKEQEDPSVQTVDPKDFRYPGPKPQSREAALVMLADAVEAASKVLSAPTPARIRGVVQKVINDIFIDGQLDESNLTLRDLHQIAKSFTRTITGILHHRIDYPESHGGVRDDTREKRMKNGSATDQEPEGPIPPESSEDVGDKDTDGPGEP